MKQFNLAGYPKDGLKSIDSYTCSDLVGAMKPELWGSLHFI